MTLRLIAIQEQPDRSGCSEDFDFLKFRGLSNFQPHFEVYLRDMLL